MKLEKYGMRLSNDTLIPLERLEVHYTPIGTMVGDVMHPRAGQAVFGIAGERTRMTRRIALADKPWDIGLPEVDVSAVIQSVINLLTAQNRIRPEHADRLLRITRNG